MSKVDKICELDNSIGSIQTEQITLAADVVIESIQNEDPTAIYQLIGGLTNNKASMTDLLLAIRDKLSK